MELQLSCDWSTTRRLKACHPLDRRDTNRGVRTQGTIELTKMSGYRLINPIVVYGSLFIVVPPTVP